jgi:hypothetical protein
MNGLGLALCQLQWSPSFITAVLFTLALGIGTNTPGFAHPGSGIVVDRLGQVYFVDTGQGVWRIGGTGEVSRHEGPAFHFMAGDPKGSGCDM